MCEWALGARATEEERTHRSLCWRTLHGRRWSSERGGRPSRRVPRGDRTTTGRTGGDQRGAERGHSSGVRASRGAGGPGPSRGETESRTLCPRRTRSSRSTPEARVPGCQSDMKVVRLMRARADRSGPEAALRQRTAVPGRSRGWRRARTSDLGPTARRRGMDVLDYLPADGDDEAGPASSRAPLERRRAAARMVLQTRLTSSPTLRGSRDGAGRARGDHRFGAFRRGGRGPGGGRGFERPRGG